MRVLLVNSPVTRVSPHARVSPPLGLAYLAGFLLDAGHKLEVLDLNLSGYNERRIALAMKRLQPQVVGVSAFTETYPNALRIAEQVKAIDPSTIVVLGGPHPSILPAESLAHDAVDYVVVGEGEATLGELLSAIESGADTAAIAGLGYRKDGTAVVNPRRAPLDPDTLGLPARDLLSLELYQDAYNVLTARGGCPYRCPFCSASHIWEGKHRPRSVVSVVNEVEMLIRQFGASHIFFVDDIFTLRRQWVVDLLGELERVRGMFTWACGTRVDRVDEELLQVMARAGCVGIQYGVESGAQEVLDSVKGIEKQAALDAVRWSVAAGIGTTASFMVPFPQDTEETLRETFDFMEQLKNEGAQILMSYTTPYPGTVFYDRAEELGLRILTRDWGEYDAKHLIMETANLTADRLEAIISENVSRMGMSKTA
jgi:radical SAM superfamily enzyme YgiQ (UPF0313 family)